MREGAAAFKDESGNQLSPDAAKARLRKAILLYAEKDFARKDAYHFLNLLSEGKSKEHPYTTGDLAQMARTNNLIVKTTKPFDLDDPPAELPVPERGLRLLLSLRADDPDDEDRSMLYASSPLESTNAFYIVGLEKRIPSTVQPLSAVHDKVAADYRETMALEKAKDAGKRFESELQAGMAQGKTFDTMSAAQFVHPKKLSPFSLTTTSIPEMTNRVEFEELQNIAGKMQAGQATPFIPTPDGGLIFYVKARLPVDDAEVKKNFPAYLERMREQLQIAAFQEWFGKAFHDHVTMPPGDSAAAGG